MSNLLVILSCPSTRSTGNSDVNNGSIKLERDELSNDSAKLEYNLAIPVQAGCSTITPMCDKRFLEAAGTVHIHGHIRPDSDDPNNYVSKEYMEDRGRPTGSEESEDDSIPHYASDSESENGTTSGSDDYASSNAALPFGCDTDTDEEDSDTRNDAEDDVPLYVGMSFTVPAHILVCVSVVSVSS